MQHVQHVPARRPRATYQSRYMLPFEKQSLLLVNPPPKQIVALIPRRQVCSLEIHPSVIVPSTGAMSTARQYGPPLEAG